MVNEQSNPAEQPAGQKAPGTPGFNFLEDIFKNKNPGDYTHIVTGWEEFRQYHIIHIKSKAHVGTIVRGKGRDWGTEEKSVRFGKEETSVKNQDGDTIGKIRGTHFYSGYVSRCEIFDNNNKHMGYLDWYWNLYDSRKQIIGQEVRYFSVYRSPMDAYGNLEECFIATAVYGDANAPQVQALRNFRDEVLMQNAAGKAFVAFYYSGMGEKTAEFIKGHFPSSIPVIRKSLDYVVAKIQERKGNQK